MKFAHIINPVKVKKDRDLYFAQPVTFETFKIAKSFSKIDVIQCSVQYEEDRDIIPDHIKILDNLSQSVLDKGDFKYKLPFIKEIFKIGYENNIDADFLIYTDSDIALMPNFYLSIKNILEQGYDSIIVNRRDISDSKKEIKDIPYMYSQVGVKHSGWDCYIIKTSDYKSFNFENSIVGAVGDGEIIRANMINNSKNFIELKNEHLTFHLGISPRKTGQYSDIDWVKLNLYNNGQAKIVIQNIINNSNQKDLKWAEMRLDFLKNRENLYLDALNGSNRFFGYWKLKKIYNFFFKHFRNS